MGNEKQQAERLWQILTGDNPNAQGHDPDEVVERLARFGEAAAAIVLRDVRAAVEFEFGQQDKDSLITTLESGEDDEDEYGYSELSWRHPWLDEDRLGGAGNVIRIRMMLEEIGGSTARRAISLLSLAEGSSEAVSPKSISSLAAVLSGLSAEAAITAAHALGKIGSDAVDPLLAVLSTDARVSDNWIERGQTFQTVRSAAVRALWRIGDRRAVAALVEAIGIYDQWTSEVAIDAVVALGGDSRAVVPILQASLPVECSNRDWNFNGRIAAVQRMGPQSFDALVSAATNPNWQTRSLALWALTEIVEVASTADDERMKQRERAAACGVAGLTDPKASVRVAAIKLISRMNIANLVNHLVLLIGDTAEDEMSWSYGDGSSFTVGQAAVEAFPDNDEVLESLRQALIDGSLDPIRAWVSFLDLNDYDEQKRGSARHAKALVSCILEKAKCGDQEAVDALGYPSTTSLLERMGGAYLDEAEEVLDAFEQEAVFGRTLLRWLYQVGSEFRETGGDVWKIVRRIPETDAWHSLIFDVAHSGSKAVRQNTRQSWWNMSVVASLIPVEPGTFKRTTQTFEEQKAREASVAALKARHGSDPRSVPLLEIATVQQFADVVGVTAADVQKSAGKHGKLLGHREQIAPDLLAALCGDFNVIFAHEDTV